MEFQTSIGKRYDEMRGRNLSENQRKQLNEYKKRFQNYDWKSDLDYDAWDDEDQERKAAGKLPKKYEKTYDMSDPVDRALYYNGLPARENIASKAKDADKHREKLQEEVDERNFRIGREEAKKEPFRQVYKTVRNVTGNLYSGGNDSVQKPAGLPMVENNQGGTLNKTLGNGGQVYDLPGVYTGNAKWYEAPDVDVMSSAAPVAPKPETWESPALPVNPAHMKVDAVSSAQAALPQSEQYKEWLQNNRQYSPQESVYKFNEAIQEKERQRQEKDYQITNQNLAQTYHNPDFEFQSGSFDFDTLPDKIKLRVLQDYSYMTEEQKQIFTYWAERDPQTAERYLEGIQGEINATKGYAEAKETLNSPLRGLKASGNAFVGGLDKFAASLGDAWGMMTGDYTPSAITASNYAHAYTTPELPQGERIMADALYSGANMLPNALLGAVNPTLGLATTAVSTFGSSYGDAMREGKTVSQAQKMATLSALSETGLQYALGGIAGLAGKHGGQLAKGIKKVLGKVTEAASKTKLGGFLYDLTVNAGSEFVEEYLQETFESQFRNLAYGENNEYQFFSEEALYAGVLGAISSAGMNAATDIMTGRFKNTTPELVQSAQEFIASDGNASDQVTTATPSTLPMAETKAQADPLPAVETEEQPIQKTIAQPNEISLNPDSGSDIAETLPMTEDFASLEAALPIDEGRSSEIRTISPEQFAQEQALDALFADIAEREEIGYFEGMTEAEREAEESRLAAKYEEMMRQLVPEEQPVQPTARQVDSRTYTNEQRQTIIGRFRELFSEITGGYKLPRGTTPLLNRAIEESKRGGITEQTRNELFDTVVAGARQGESTVQLASQWLKGMTFKPGNLGKEVIRESNLGVKFSQSGSDIDVAYQELNQMYPDLFPDELTDVESQIRRIGEVRKAAAKKGSELLSGNEARDQFNALVDDLEAAFSTPEMTKADYADWNKALEESGGIEGSQVPVSLDQGKTKTNKTVKSILESDLPNEVKTRVQKAALDEIRQKELAPELETSYSHVVKTDKAAADWAHQQIAEFGMDQAIKNFEFNAERGTLSKNDVVGAIVYARIKMAEGDFRTAERLLAKGGAMASQGGQVAQAWSVLKKLSPEGRLYYWDSVVKQLNQRYDKKLSRQARKSMDNSMNQLVRSQDENVSKAAQELKHALANYKKTGDQTGVSEAWDALVSTTPESSAELSLLGDAMTTDGKFDFNKLSEIVHWQPLSAGERRTNEQLSIDDVLKEQLRDAKTPEEIAEAEKQIQEVIAQQIPNTWPEVVRALRYFAMLANPKTHTRNLQGNGSMDLMRRMKDRIGGVMELAIPKEQRTKTVVKSKLYKEARAFANKDFETISEIVEGGTKYDNLSKLEREKPVFKGENAATRVLNKLIESNNKLLGAEDTFFLKRIYSDAFAKVVDARGYNAAQIQNHLGEIREIAIREAQKATFHNTNFFADWIQKLDKGGTAARLFREAAMPFVKTPANVVARTLEYSPIGLVRSAVKAAVGLRNGDFDASTIDGLASGISGTALVGLGVYLASMGLLHGSGDENEEKRYFDEERGIQSNSVEIGGRTYTIDSLGPLAAGLLLGANLFELGKSEGQVTPDSVLNRISGVSQPVFELTMLQGLMDFISGAYGDDPISSVAKNTMTGIPLQLIRPSVAGAISRTIDGKRRDAYVAKDDPWGQTFGKARNKTLNTWAPGTLPEYVDRWGRAEDQGGVLSRAAENFLLPTYISEVSNDPADAEIDRLYDATGSAAVLPGKYFNGEIKYDDASYYATPEERQRFLTTRGQSDYELVSELIDLPLYKELPDEDKADVLSAAYSYSDAKAKQEFFESRGVEYDLPSAVAKADEAAELGFSPAEWYIIRDMVNGVEYDAAYDKAMSNAHRNVIYGLPMADWQKDGLFELFDVSPEYKEETLKKGD